MALPEDWNELDTEVREEWLLQAVDAAPLPLADLHEAIRGTAAAGQRHRARTWCDLVLDAVTGARDEEGTVGTLALLAGLTDNPAALQAACEQRLGQVFKSRAAKARLEAAGFGSDTAAAEALRRLQRLLDLEPGVLCHDGTWGFGVVRSVDAFYGKVTIDFESKPGHAMSFAYAAETLELLPEDHILAVRHRDPEAVARRVRDDPAAVVRLALESYGAMPVPLLRERLEAGIVDPADWKRFWDAARKQLKADPLVEIPVRRNEPVRLLSREKRYDAAWFESLAAERDMATILRRVQAFEAESEGSAPDDTAWHVLADRLGFVALGAETREPGLAAAACVAAARLGVADNATIRRVAGRLLEPARFAAAAESIAARELGAFVDFLSRHDEAALRSMLLSSLGVFPVRVLDEAVPRLEAMGLTDACVAALREAIAGVQPPVTVTCWLARHLDWAEQHAAAGTDELLLRIVEAFERDVAGDELKARNALRDLVSQDGWLEGVLDSLAPVQREMFLKRVMKAAGWDAAERRSVMARVIKRYPELQRVTETAEQAPARPVRVRRTSWRSYRERQAVLKKLIEVDIPDNSREIGVARSYGDLRENFEYQAAKDRQRLLMQRQAELETELKTVTGTDFETVDSGRVGPGTCVWIRGDDGREERITVLGEWDRDEALGIIGGGSALARSLEGLATGDTAEIPGAGGMRRVRITRLGPLEDDIRAWMKARGGY